MYRRFLSHHDELSVLSRVPGLDAEKTGNNDKASILQRNLFVLLGSVEMIVLARLMTIIHLSVSMPFRWLAGKKYELVKYITGGRPPWHK